MGIEKHGIKFILRAIKHHGLNTRETLTLGRQGLHTNIDELSSLLPGSSSKLLESRYAESFLEYLGAKKVDSMDASSYEGATIVHDLNLPISSELYGKYSAVIDGGTLEHILNLPTALQNAINLLKKNGHLIMFSPANNFFGHGFYQFSPELFDGVFGEHNGMELIEMIACECFDDEMRWFQVAKPSEIGRRVLLRSHFCVLLLVIAKRTSDVPVDKIIAMQSDYAVAWVNNEKAIGIHAQSILRKFWLIDFIKSLARKFVYTNRLSQDSKAFRELDNF
jgi:hypothetical protein